MDVPEEKENKNDPRTNFKRAHEYADHGPF